MKLSNLLSLSALVPIFALTLAALPPADTGTRMMHLRFAPVPDRVGDAGATEARFLITNDAQFDQLFGEGRRTIDFDHEWAFFYSAGWMPTTGYEAVVLDVAYMPDTHTLVFTTQLASPGRNCIVGQMLTKPYSLVKFPIPPGRVDAVRYVMDDITVDCR